MTRKTKADTEENLEGVKETNVGASLKEARLAKNLSLEDISKTLCITKSFLVRLEDHSDALSVDVYTLGFLKSYAKFLALDADKLSAQFKNANTTIEKTEELTFPKPLPKRGIPHVRVVSVSLAFAFLLAVGWETITKISPTQTTSLDIEKVSREEVAMTSAHAMSETQTESEDEIIKVAAVEVPSEAPKVFTGESPQRAGPQSFNNNSIESETPTETNAPAHIQSSSFEAVQTVQSHLNPSVMMSFSEESWVQIKDGQGQVVVNRTFKPGEQYELKSPQGHTLRAGNAGGINLMVSGKDLGKLGPTGQVMGNISLDPEKLLDQPIETH